jgi:hypothetical protein
MSIVTTRHTKAFDPRPIAFSIRTAMIARRLVGSPWCGGLEWSHESAAVQSEGMMASKAWTYLPSEEEAGALEVDRPFYEGFGILTGLM